MDIDQFFDGFPESRLLFDTLMGKIYDIGQFDLKVTKSQIALYRGRSFAWIWIPEKHLKRKAAPLVLSIVFPVRDQSPRWKEIVELSKGKYMHHLEIHSIGEIDDRVLSWLKAAWTTSGVSD